MESATRFIFLNKTCYNGLYRVNKDNEFNVPFGGYKRPAIFDEGNIMAASFALRETQAELYAEDYSYTLDNCGPQDFVYFDPPYFPTSKTAAFTDYTVNGFTEEDQNKLSDSFSKLVQRGCNVILTNSDTPLVRRLYGQYVRKRIPVKRFINSVGTRRSGFYEVIVSSAPSKRSRSGSMNYLLLFAQKAKGMKLPQANDVGRIMKIIETVGLGSNDSSKVAKKMGFNVRQSSYYRDAAEILGFLDPRRPYHLTDLGRQYLVFRSARKGEDDACGTLPISLDLDNHCLPRIGVSQRCFEASS